MSEDSDKPGAAETPAGGNPGRPARSGRGLAALALLLACAALAGVGYLYDRLLLRGGDQAAAPDTRALAERLARLEAEVAARLDTAATAAAGVGEGSLDALRRDLEARIAAATGPELDTRIRDLTADAAAAPPPDARAWQLAEVGYLLRMANQRLLMERDAPGALGLLRAADRTLAELDDFALHEVRARIAAEVLALEGLPVLDAEGLFLQLEAIKSDLGDLPLRLPALEPLPAEAAPEGDVWAALRQELARLVRFRRFEGAVRPLLAPEEAVYLELNLRLMLERAQLAALRGEQAIYEQSIRTARGWVEEYLDVGTAEAARVRDGLRAVEGVRLAPPLPDISGSLNALNALTGSRP